MRETIGKLSAQRTVDINESNKGDPVKAFIIEVTAVSWASTQVPEIIASAQSFLNAGFRGAAPSGVRTHDRR